MSKFWGVIVVLALIAATGFIIAFRKSIIKFFGIGKELFSGVKELIPFQDEELKIFQNKDEQAYHIAQDLLNEFDGWTKNKLIVDKINSLDSWKLYYLVKEKFGQELRGNLDTNLRYELTKKEYESLKFKG